MKYIVFHNQAEGLVMAPRMVDMLKDLPDVLDVREVRLHSMQPYFWEGLEEAITATSQTEGCAFVCWGPADRYGNCPVPILEAKSFSDVLSYCEGRRPEVKERNADGVPTYTVWERIKGNGTLTREPEST